MNNPKCPKGKIATMVCVTETCHRYAFMCTKCQNFTCQKAHQYCKTMLWSSALERINNYEKYETPQFEEYIKKVGKIYDNILKRIQAEKALFRENIENMLYNNEYQKVKHYISKEEFNKIEPKDIGLLITKMTSKTCNYELQSFYLSDMKNLDSQITSLFQSIEKLYKKKLKSSDSKSSKEKITLNSMTQSLVLKRQDKSKTLNSSLKKENPSTQRLLSGKIDLSYPQHIDSRIVPNATSINYFIGTKVKSYKLLYRASQNNFQIQQFYKKCIHSTSTMILVKTEHGKVVGGFTKLQWKRNQSNLNDSFESSDEPTKEKNTKYKEDLRGSSIFFSVDLNEKYQLMEPKFAIYCGKNSIGFGKGDLRIVNHGQKHVKNYIGFPSSFNNGLYLPIQKSSLVLSGSRHSNHFRLKQWEAFEVIFQQKK